MFNQLTFQNKEGKNHKKMKRRDVTNPYIQKFVYNIPKIHKNAQIEWINVVSRVSSVHVHKAWNHAKTPLTDTVFQQPKSQ